MLNIKLFKRFILSRISDAHFQALKDLASYHDSIDKITACKLCEMKYRRDIFHTMDLSQAFLFCLKDSTTSKKSNGQNYVISPY